MTANKNVEFKPENYTILVIDDTIANITLLVDFLTEQGFRVLTARNGKSGIQRAAYGQPDLILLDVLMPKIDGFETCRQLKELPETQNIPVIFMTALDSVDQKVRGFDVGGVDYVTKPFQQAELIARLKTHLINNELTQHLNQLVNQRTKELQGSLEREQQLRKELAESLDKERELSTLKSRIIEAVNHEFRTPLAVINQAAWLLSKLLDKLTPEKLVELNNRLQQATHDITESLHALQDTKSLTDGTFMIDRQIIEWTTFESQLTDLITGFKEDAKRINLTIAMPANALTMQIDIDHIMSIVKELVTNAAKYSAAPQPIYVNVAVQGTTLTIKVRDKGIGIPADARDKIFDAFYRATNVNARRGLGIGLYQAKMISQLLGGNLQVSEVGDSRGGTEFVLTIPEVVQESESSPRQFVKPNFFCAVGVC